MENEIGIIYSQKKIDNIPYEILKKGLFWLKPNIIKTRGFSQNEDLDLVWQDDGKYVAQRISFDDVKKIAQNMGGKLLEKYNNLFKLKADYENLPMSHMKIMGILNLTPDSFSDGGDFILEKNALEHAHKMRDCGADIIDIGGESTKPNANYVDDLEESNRIVKIIKKLSYDNFLISADTRKPSVMTQAIDNGARIINDISGMSDPLTPKIISKSGASIVIMHIKGSPKTMQINPKYKCAPIEIYNFLEKKIEFALSEGIKLNRIAIDPGFGFGKSPLHNMQIMAWLPMFQSLGVPVLLGVSRKSSIAALSKNETPKERLAGSIALLCYANLFGTQIIRVHDVMETSQAINICSNVNRQI